MKGVRAAFRTGCAPAAVLTLVASIQLSHDLSATNVNTHSDLKEKNVPSCEEQATIDVAEEPSRQLTATAPQDAATGTTLSETVDPSPVFVSCTEEDAHKYDALSSESSDARETILQVGRREVSLNDSASHRIYEADTNIEERQIIAAAMLVAKGLEARKARAGPALSGPAKTKEEAFGMVEALVRQQALKDCLASKVETQALLEGAQDGNGVSPFTKAVLVDRQHTIDLERTVACNTPVAASREPPSKSAL